MMIQLLPSYEVKKFTIMYTCGYNVSLIETALDKNAMG